MPPPPSNPLTMLRKLGTSLIGRDGLLTNAASVTLGYSPMDRVKNRLAAQAQVESELKFKSGLDADARKAQADQLALDTNTYELGRKRTVDTQTDAERAARGAAVAAALMPGPPNPDGSPIMDPGTALGQLQGRTDLLKLDAADQQSEVSAPLIEALKRTGMDVSSIVPGMKLPDKQIQLLMSAAGIHEQIAGRRAVAQDAAANRAIQRDAMSGTRRLNTFLDEQNRVAQSPQIRASQQIIASALDTQAQVDHYKQAIQSGDTTAANQILGEVITVAFAKVRDPNSVVREGEVIRLLAQWGLADRAGNWLNKQIDGGVLPPDALLKLGQALKVDAGVSYRIIKGEQDRLEQMRLGDPQSGALPEYYRRDFSFGYTPEGGPAPGVAPGPTPAPLSPPASKLPPSPLDAFRNRHNIRRPQ